MATQSFLHTHMENCHLSFAYRYAFNANMRYDKTTIHHTTLFTKEPTMQQIKHPPLSYFTFSLDKNTTKLYQNISLNLKFCFNIYALMHIQKHKCIYILNIFLVWWNSPYLSLIFLLRHILDFVAFIQAGHIPNTWKRLFSFPE